MERFSLSMEFSLFLYHSLQAQLKNSDFIEFSGKLDKRIGFLQLIVFHTSQPSWLSFQITTVSYYVRCKAGKLFFLSVENWVVKLCFFFPEGDGIHYLENLKRGAKMLGWDMIDMFIAWTMVLNKQKHSLYRSIHSTGQTPTKPLHKRQTRSLSFLLHFALEHRF